MELKTSHKGQFWNVSSESWINTLSIDVWFVRTISGWDTTIWKSGIWGCNKKIEKITFKIVQMKFLEMHITNQKLSFDIFTVGNLQNIFMERNLYPNEFWHKRKMDNFDPYNVLSAIATNIPQRLKTGFMVQGHICDACIVYCVYLLCIFKYTHSVYILKIITCIYMCIYLYSYNLYYI